MIFSKLIGDKKRWNAYKTRTRQLPETYRSAIEAMERYVFYFASSKPDPLMTLLEDLGDLFEQAAANNTPLRAVVGEDPVAFIETFLQNYPESSWISAERARLVSTLAQAERENANFRSRPSQ